MKILFIGPRYHTNLHYPVKTLLEAGHEVAFYALRRGGSEEYSALTPKVFGHSRLFDVIVALLGRENSEGFIFRFAFPPVRQFWREVKAFRPSVVIVRDPNTAYGLLAILVAKAVRAKLIFYTQGPKYRKMGPIQRFMRTFILTIVGAQWITPVLGSQEPGASTIKRMHYVPFVIPPGILPEAKEWFIGGAVNIVTIGKFLPRKNHILLLRALKELAEEFQVRLTIVGECTTQAHYEELKRIQAYIKALELEGLVEIKVNLPFSKVQELYAVHDLFVLPSSNEPAAVSILEAMAYGLPVICSDSNGTKCYIEEGQNGFVFHSDDLQDLIAKIRLVIEDRKRLIDMGRYSFQLVLERHRPESYVEAIIKIAVNKTPPQNKKVRYEGNKERNR